MEHVVQNAILQVDALRDVTRSPRKLRILEPYFESLYKVLDNYHVLHDRQLGLQ